MNNMFVASILLSALNIVISRVYMVKKEDKKSNFALLLALVFVLLSSCFTE